MSATDSTNRRWTRLSLATFLFASLCAGAIVAGYHSGYRHGYNFGQSAAKEPQVTQTYKTTPFILPDVSPVERAAEFDTLRNLIQSTISTDIWNDRTGNDISDLAASQSLSVTAPESVQSEIRDLLAQLESLSTRGAADELLPSLQGMASCGKSHEWDLPNSAPKESHAADAYIEKYFNATIAGITNHWGQPQYNGEFHDVGFPPWSSDRKIATWPRGAGLSYISLRAADDGHLKMVVGWRENS